MISCVWVNPDFYVWVEWSKVESSLNLLQSLSPAQFTSQHNTIINKIFRQDHGPWSSVKIFYYCYRYHRQTLLLLLLLSHLGLYNQMLNVLLVTEWVGSKLAKQCDTLLFKWRGVFSTETIWRSIQHYFYFSLLLPSSPSRVLIILFSARLVIIIIDVITVIIFNTNIELQFNTQDSSAKEYCRRKNNFPWSPSRYVL